MKGAPFPFLTNKKAGLFFRASMDFMVSSSSLLNPFLENCSEAFLEGVFSREHKLLNSQNPKNQQPGLLSSPPPTRQQAVLSDWNGHSLVYLFGRLLA